jgi:hypothetical protein
MDKEQLHRLIAKGLTNKQICKEMGCTIGVVAGNRHRYLEKHPELKKVRPKKTRRSPRVPLPQSKMTVREKKGPRNVSLFDLKRSHCHWPKANNLYCGADVVPGQSYCHAHCLIAYPLYARRFGVLEESVDDRQ